MGQYLDICARVTSLDSSVNLLACYKARVLDILALNEMTAIGVGINVTKERKRLLVLAVLLAGACVAVGGGLTFLGLIAPHIAKN